MYIDFGLSYPKLRIHFLSVTMDVNAKHHPVFGTWPAAYWLAPAESRIRYRGIIPALSLCQCFGMVTLCLEY